MVVTFRNTPLSRAQRHSTKARPSARTWMSRVPPRGPRTGVRPKRPRFGAMCLGWRGHWRRQGVLRNRGWGHASDVALGVAQFFVFSFRNVIESLSLSIVGFFSDSTLLGWTTDTIKMMLRICTCMDVHELCFALPVALKFHVEKIGLYVYWYRNAAFSTIPKGGKQIRKKSSISRFVSLWVLWLLWAQISFFSPFAISICLGKSKSLNWLSAVRKACCRSRWLAQAGWFAASKRDVNIHTRKMILLL
jgi:hypothetical protein